MTKLRHLSFAILLTASPALADDVGVMAAINRDVTGERPAEAPRALVLNDRLILDERVTTSTSGGGQVMFLDQTTLTLSPNSDIILDRYVYDPASQSGEVSISMLKGAMRLVGGRITKTGGATVRTPTATIGIRGGIGHVTVEPDGSTSYIHVAGQSSTVENDTGSETVTREGATVYVPANPGDVSEAPIVEGDVGRGESSINPEVEARVNEVLLRRADRDRREELMGRIGGLPRFAGIAGRQEIKRALNRGAGVGDGGEREPVTVQRVADGVNQIELRVSALGGAPQEPPISTSGEREEERLGEVPIGLGEPPFDEFADSNIGRDIADEINQVVDGLEFQSRWSAVAGLNDGTFAPVTDDLRMDMQFSLSRGEGLVLVELPETGDLAVANLETLSGVSVKGDRFLVVSDGDLNLTGDSGLATLLGGDATNTELQILVNDEGRGVIAIDYNGSGLANLQFVDGDITPVVGDRVAGEPIDDLIDEFRRNR